MGVPATVQTVLAARIDRLPAEAKRLLQTAAVIGKDVPYALLAGVVDTGHDDLPRWLAALVAAEFLYETHAGPDVAYTFKHALTHEVAYGSLLRTTRVEHHAGIARAIMEHFPALADTQPELVAHHYTEAGLTEPALAHWLRAGRRARARSADIEAVRSLSTLARNFGDVFHRVHAARRRGVRASLARRAARSRRVNVHWNGVAACA